MTAPRRVTLVRSLLLAIAVAASAAACAQLARAAVGDPPASTASVTIAPSGGGEPRRVVLAELAAQHDVHDATYTLRAADGATSRLTVASGISLDALLRAAGLEGDAFTYVEVARLDGSTALVLRDQLTGGDGGPPVVWSDAQGTHFLRPAVADDDPNATDHVVLADGATLQVKLRTGDPIGARISASALRARPNEAIDFSASLVAGALGPGMTFQWYFDDDRFATGANVTHRFREARRHTVILSIMRGDEQLGAPAFAVVRIERPARQREDDGARRSGERRDGQAGTGADDDGGGLGAGAGTGAGGGFDAADPGPVAPPVAPAAPPAAPPAPPPARPRARRTPAPEPRGEVVSGTLLASASGVPPAGGGAQPAGASGATASDDPLAVPTGVWAAIALAALLALGWTLESRHTLPFWQP